jgi:hypothetical protein
MGGHAAGGWPTGEQNAGHSGMEKRQNGIARGGKKKRNEVFFKWVIIMGN